MYNIAADQKVDQKGQYGNYYRLSLICEIQLWGLYCVEFQLFWCQKLKFIIQQYDNDDNHDKNITNDW